MVMKKLLFLLLLLPGLASAQTAQRTARTHYNYDVSSTSYIYCKYLGSNSNPYGSEIPGYGRIKTTGSTTTLDELDSASDSFTGMAVGDLLVIRTSGATSLRRIVTFTSVSQVVVDAAINLGTAGVAFTWLKQSCGTTATDGWIDVSGFWKLNFERVLTTINATSIQTQVECQLAGVGIQTMDTSSVTVAGTYNFPINTGVWDSCRMGVKVTGDGGVQSISGGIAFQSAEVVPHSVEVQTFTATGTWTKPEGCNEVTVICYGAGGGGGAGDGGNNAERRAGIGGGGGGRVEKTFLCSDITSPVTVTVGAGGTGGTGAAGTSGGNGTAGGSSTFGAYLVASGGGFGPGGTGAADGSGGGGGGTCVFHTSQNGAMGAGTYGNCNHLNSAFAMDGVGGGQTGGSAGSFATTGGGGGGGGTTTVGTAGGASVYGGGGGGSGGAGAASRNGGAGGASAITTGFGATSGGGGTAGTGSAAGACAGGTAGGDGAGGSSIRGGAGGGGGGSCSSAGLTGKNGGAGGTPAGGGGGGGGGNGQGGNGGAGGNGACYVITR